LVLATFLIGCGGGGGGTSAPVVINPPADNGSALAVPDLGAVAVGATSSALAPGWMRGAFMEIYVRGYMDSDGDGKGDLKGLVSKLDYLKDLGIRGIWLMPVTDSADRDHGYAVKNYRAIEADYGSMADFDLLLAEAHKRGIGVIMDYVINHSAVEHPLFRNSASSATNAQRDYFVWQTSKPSGWSIYGTDPWYSGGGGYYFAGFWSGMPDFNWKNGKVEEFHQDNLRFWLNKGVDGMRFDAVGNLVENGPAAWEIQPDNHAIMGRVQQTFNNYQQRYMVCEVPAASQAFAASTSCGSAFAFDLMGSIVGAAKGQAASIQTLSQYFASAPPTMATLVSNHDRFAGDRLWSQVQGDTARYKLAAASYLLLPGTPFIYYGEEVGMDGGVGLSGDAALRVPMSWSADKSGFTSGTPFRNVASNAATQNVAAQTAQPNSLLNWYKQLLALRNTLPSIASGSYVAPFVNGQTMGFQRQLGSERVLVLINYGTSSANVAVQDLPANVKLASRLGLAATTSSDPTGRVTLPIGAQSVEVYLLQP
jgi:glycosidase